MVLSPLKGDGEQGLGTWMPQVRDRHRGREVGWGILSRGMTTGPSGGRGLGSRCL